MKFDSPEEVEMACWQMKYSDYSRGLNRALINQLFNGSPPYTDAEVEENGLEVNVNFLEPTRLGHDGRSQFYNAFLKPGGYFKATTDAGPQHRRQDIATTVTAAVNKRMKRSIEYFEGKRSQIALDVLHGVGPLAWENDDAWCPIALGIEDVFLPSQTLLTMRNLPFFALYKSFTAPELIKLTKNAPKDSGWNMELVKSCIEWVDTKAAELMGTNWPDVWSPEKTEERFKSDGALYSTDAVPTIDCYDFYFWNDEGNTEGWRRRIIIDAWTNPSQSAAGVTMNRNNDLPKGGGFLFSSGDRPHADHREQIVSFQFADLSAVSPFRYHSVRSLGFLLYSVCHLQNRLRCRFTEKVFEDMMLLFRVKTEDEIQRLIKTNFINKGFIDSNLEIVPAEQRGQFNPELAEMGMNENARLIQANASTMAANPGAVGPQPEKTRTQWLGEFSAMNSLIASGINQAYQYSVFEYREILRRFFRKDSRDHDVKAFRAEVLRAGVPEKALNIDAWDLEPERTMGGGNMSMEMAIADWLMQHREKFDPDPQREILRTAVFSVTGDAGLTKELVPIKRVQLTEAAKDAQLAFGTLMGGYSVGIESGINHVDYIETMLTEMAQVVGKAEQAGGILPGDKIAGLDAVAQHIAGHMAILAQNPEEKQRVKQYGDVLGKLMNQVKAFAQRLQEQMEAQAKQNGNGGIDPQTAAKVQATMLTAKTKAELAAQSHAERTAQKALTWQQQMKQREAENALKLRQQQQKHAVELAATDLTAATEIRRNRMKSTED